MMKNFVLLQMVHFFFVSFVLSYFLVDDKMDWGGSLYRRDPDPVESPQWRLQNLTCQFFGEMICDDGGGVGETQKGLRLFPPQSSDDCEPLEDNSTLAGSSAVD